MLASDNDSPAAPSTGRALLRRFRFEDLFVCDMGPFSTIPHTQTLVFDLSLFVWKIFFRSLHSYCRQGDSDNKSRRAKTNGKRPGGSLQEQNKKRGQTPAEKGLAP
jgi:hypothetical protein